MSWRLPAIPRLLALSFPSRPSTALRTRSVPCFRVYQPRLGAPGFEWLGLPIYHPWRLFEWWFFFDAYAPDVFNVGGSSDCVAGAEQAFPVRRTLGALASDGPVGDVL